MLPGTRRAINNQINEKYFLPRVDRRGKGERGVCARVHLRITPVRYPVYACERGKREAGGRERERRFKRRLGLFGEALRGVISSGNCQVAQQRRNLEI